MKFKFLAAVNMSIVKVTVFWDVVSFYQTTRCSIPKFNQLHTSRHENLKSHHVYCGLLGCDAVGLYIVL